MPNNPQKPNSTESLIQALVADHKPCKRLWPVWMVALIILLVAVFYCFGCITALYGISGHIAAIFKSVFLELDILLSFIFAVLTLVIVLKSAIPGKEHYAKRGLKVAHAGLISIIVLNIFFTTWQWPLTYSYLETAHCAFDILLYALVPMVVTFYAIKRAAPVDIKRTGHLAIYSMTFFGYAATRITCQMEDSVHSISAHLIPLIVFAMVSRFMGKKFLRW